MNAQHPHSTAAASYPTSNSLQPPNTLISNNTMSASALAPPHSVALHQPHTLQTAVTTAAIAAHAAVAAGIAASRQHVAVSSSIAATASVPPTIQHWIPHLAAAVASSGGADHVAAVCTAAAAVAAAGHPTFPFSPRFSPPGPIMATRSVPGNPTLQSQPPAHQLFPQHPHLPPLGSQLHTQQHRHDAVAAAAAAAAHAAVAMVVPPNTRQSHGLTTAFQDIHHIQAVVRF
jgi:hypothetical protein